MISKGVNPLFRVVKQQQLVIMVDLCFVQYRWNFRWWYCLMSISVLLILNRYTPSIALTIVSPNHLSSPTWGIKSKKRDHIVRLYESAAAIVDDDTNTNKPESSPFAILVQTEIVPERLTEFLQLIEHNAIQSRKEPECIRFDVIQSQEQSNKFFFYEIYTNNHSAIEHHKLQSHYQAWADFKETGGTLSSTTYKSSGLFLTE